jgi:hypothetical protein
LRRRRALFAIDFNALPLDSFPPPPPHSSAILFEPTREDTRRARGDGFSRRFRVRTHAFACVLCLTFYVNPKPQNPKKTLVRETDAFYSELGDDDDEEEEEEGGGAHHVLFARRDDHDSFCRDCVSAKTTFVFFIRFFFFFFFPEEKGVFSPGGDFR